MSKYIALIFILMFVLSFTAAAEPTYATWWNTTWLYSKNITHTNYQTIAHNQENVRVLFGHGGHASYATKCSDIRVVNSDGTEIISTNANTSAGSGNPVLRCDSTYAEVVYNITVGASTNVNYTIYYGASGVGNASYSKYPYYFNDTFLKYTSGYPLNTALNGTYYVTNNGTLGATSLANATWNTTGGGYEGFQANVFARSGGEASQFIDINATNFTLMPNQSVNISFTWETMSHTNAATNRFAAIFSFLTTPNYTTGSMDAYQIWQRQGDLNKNRLFRTFSYNRSTADFTAAPHPTELFKSYFDVDSVYGERYKRWGYTISLWNASAIATNGNVNFTIDMYLDENGGISVPFNASGAPNMTYYVIDYGGYPKFGSFGWGAWAYADGGAAPVWGWSRITNLTVASSPIYNSTFYSEATSEMSGWSWTAPTANATSGIIGDGFQFNSTLSSATGNGTVINVSAIFNNTVYAITAAGEGSYYKDVSLPVVTTSTSIPYYYSASVLIDNSTVGTITSTTAYVTVAPVNITACSVGGTQIFRFDMWDEEDMSSQSGTLEATFKIYSSSTDYSYSNVSLSGNHTHLLCVNPNTTSSFVVDGDIKYENYTLSGLYPARWYFLRQATYGNTSNTIDLYMLNSTYATDIQFKTINVNGVNQPNVLLNVQRWYPSLALYKTVAMGLTGDDGTTSIRLRPYEVYYKILASQSGTLLQSFATTVISSTTNTLTIPNIFIGEYWQNYNNIYASCSFNNATFILTCTGTTIDGTSENYGLHVQEVENVGVTELCDTTGSGAAVTLYCSIGNNTDRVIKYTFYQVGGNHEIWVSGMIEDMFNSEFGVYGLLFAVMIILSLTFVGLWNPAVALTFSLLGLIVSLSLGLVSISMSAVVAIVLVIFIAIVRVRA